MSEYNVTAWRQNHSIFYAEVVEFVVEVPSLIWEGARIAIGDERWWKVSRDVTEDVSLGTARS